MHVRCALTAWMYGTVYVYGLHVRYASTVHMYRINGQTACTVCVHDIYARYASTVHCGTVPYARCVSTIYSYHIDAPCRYMVRTYHIDDVPCACTIYMRGMHVRPTGTIYMCSIRVIFSCTTDIYLRTLIRFIKTQTTKKRPVRWYIFGTAEPATN